MEILVGVGLHAWCTVALKWFEACLKKGKVQENIYRLCNVKQLEQDIKSRCNLNFLYIAWKLMCSIYKSDMHVRPMWLSILCTPTDSSDKT